MRSRPSCTTCAACSTVTTRDHDDHLPLGRAPFALARPVARFRLPGIRLVAGEGTRVDSYCLASGSVGGGSGGPNRRQQCWGRETGSAGAGSPRGQMNVNRRSISVVWRWSSGRGDPRHQRGFARLTIFLVKNFYPRPHSAYPRHHWQCNGEPPGVHRRRELLLCACE